MSDIPRKRRFLRLLRPRLLWRVLCRQSNDPGILAYSLALGVFIGILPLYGLQTILCIFLAYRLKLSAVAALAGSFISTPPVGPLLIAAGMCLGHLILTGTCLSAADLSVARSGITSLAGRLLLDWAVGSLIVAGMLSSITFLTARLLFGLLAKRKRTAARPEPVKHPKKDSDG